MLGVDWNRTQDLSGMSRLDPIIVLECFEMMLVRSLALTFFDPVSCLRTS